jgi:hypothetical protein
MICEEIRGHLVARLDDELEVPVRAVVDAHLASCRACARELAELRTVGMEVHRRLGRLPAPGRDSSFEALWSRVAAESGERRGRGLGLGRRRTAAVAARSSRPASADGHERAMADVVGRSPGRPRRAIRWSAIGGGITAVAAMAFVVSSLRSGPATAPGAASSPPASVAAGKPAEGAPAVAVAPRAQRVPAPKVAARPAEPAAGAVRLANGAPDDAAGGASERDLHVPDEVRKHPGMFLDLPIVQRLEKLRNMEAVYRDAASGEGSG